MAFAGTKYIANLHDEYSFVFFYNGVFSFLWCQVRISVFQFLRSDKCNFSAQFCFDARIFFLQHFQCVADADHNALYSEFQFLNIAFFRCDDFFPIPLVNINRMEIIQGFITANRIHIGIQTFAGTEVVTVKSHSFPFCQRVYYFSSYAGSRHFKADGTFYAVEVVVQSCGRINEQRRGYAFQIQCLRQMFFKGLMDQTDCVLCFI